MADKPIPSPLVFTGSWSDIKPSISSRMLAALAHRGFKETTPVQSATIPHFLSHKDVVVEAITGSGKTLAYLVPVLEILARKETSLDKYQVGAIIIAPTRELAKQIYKVAVDLLGSDSLFSCQLFTGSDKITKDISKLSLHGCSVMVGTPGRVLSILSEDNSPLDVKELEVLVLDEADRLLDMGFSDTLKKIISKVPKQRRTALFSATMTDELGLLIAAGLRNPVKIVVKVENLLTRQVQRTPSSLSIKYHLIAADKKLSHLCHFLQDKVDQKVMIYFATCHCVDYFSLAFKSLGCMKAFKLFELHRKIHASKRTKVYEEFGRFEAGILLCTDIAARGLDIQGIDWVIQFDAPQDPKSFIHRCGRAGRLGSSGNALFYLNPNEESYLEFLKLRKVPFEPLVCVGASDQAVCVSMEQICRDNNAKDYNLYQKSIQAFVSYIRFYKEHKAKYIFSFKKLDLAPIAILFGLLELPRMPELKDKSIDFTPTEVKFEQVLKKRQALSENTKQKIRQTRKKPQKGSI